MHPGNSTSVAGGYDPRQKGFHYPQTNVLGPQYENQQFQYPGQQQQQFWSANNNPQFQQQNYPLLNPRQLMPTQHQPNYQQQPITTIPQGTLKPTVTPINQQQNPIFPQQQQPKQHISPAGNLPATTVAPNQSVYPQQPTTGYSSLTTQPNNNINPMSARNAPAVSIQDQSVQQYLSPFSPNILNSNLNAKQFMIPTPAAVNVNYKAQVPGSNTTFSQGMSQQPDILRKILSPTPTPGQRGKDTFVTTPGLFPERSATSSLTKQNISGSNNFGESPRYSHTLGRILEESNVALTQQMEESINENPIQTNRISSKSPERTDDRHEKRPVSFRGTNFLRDRINSANIRLRKTKKDSLVSPKSLIEERNVPKTSVQLHPVSKSNLRGINQPTVSSSMLTQDKPAGGRKFSASTIRERFSLRPRDKSFEGGKDDAGQQVSKSQIHGAVLKARDKKNESHLGRRDTFPTTPSVGLEIARGSSNERKFSSVEEQRKHLENLFQAGAILEEEKKILTEFYDAENMRECTFAPEVLRTKVKNHGDSRPRDRGGQQQLTNPPRKPEKFVADQSRYRRDVEEKIQALRQKLDEGSVVKDKPDINKTSQRLVSKRLAERKQSDIHTRLYQSTKLSHPRGVPKQAERATVGYQDNVSYREKPGDRNGRETVGGGGSSFVRDDWNRGGSADGSLRHEGQKKTNGFWRERKIDDFLYEDAKRRQEKARHIDQGKSKETQNKTPSTLPTSQKMVANRILKQFVPLFYELDPMGEGKRLNLMEIGQILYKMSFLSAPANEIATGTNVQEKTLLFDMWIVLRGDELNGVNPRNLLVFILALYGIHLNFPKYNDNVAPEQFFQACNDLTSEKPPTLKVPIRKTVRPSHVEKRPTLPRGQERKTHDPFVQNESMDHSLIAHEELDPLQHAAFGSYDSDNNFYLSPEQVKKIQKVYDIFFLNAFRAEQLNKKPPKKGKHPVHTSFTYHPHILDSSRVMATSFRERLTEGIKRLFDTDRASDIEPQGEPQRTTTGEGDQFISPRPEAIDTEPGIEQKVTGRESQKGDKRYSHPDLLLMLKQAQKYAHAQAAEEKLQRELHECTFQPQTLQYRPEHEPRDSIVLDAQARFSSRGTRKMPAGPMGKHRAFELYSLARPASERRDRDARDIEYEKNCDQCTFTPAIHSLPRTSRGHLPSFRQGDTEGGQSVDKAVERLRRAREIKEQMDYFKERGYTLNAAMKMETLKFYKNENNSTQRRNSQGGRNFLVKDINISESSRLQTEESKSPPWSHSARRKAKKIIYNKTSTVQNTNENRPTTDHRLPTLAFPKLFERPQNQQDQAVPLLFVDVNLANERTERIVIYEGDTAEELSEAFCKLHNLDLEMQNRLKDLLEGQIRTLLTRIEEEMPSMSDDEISSHRAHRQTTINTRNSPQGSLRIQTSPDLREENNQN